METVKPKYGYTLEDELFPPHSLGKLIEWKHILTLNHSVYPSWCNTPHSLGKLIEWKLDVVGIWIDVLCPIISPLAGETN